MCQDLHEQESTRLTGDGNAGEGRGRIGEARSVVVAWWRLGVVVVQCCLDGCPGVPDAR